MLYLQLYFWNQNLQDFTAKLTDYDDGEYNIADRHVDGMGKVLECNLSGYKKVLTGERISTHDAHIVAKINRLSTQCGKQSLDSIAELCFQICNDVDIESKLLAMLKEHDELIRERLKSWLNDRSTWLGLLMCH